MIAVLAAFVKYKQMKATTETEVKATLDVVESRLIVRCFCALFAVGAMVAAVSLINIPTIATQASLKYLPNVIAILFICGYVAFLFGHIGVKAKLPNFLAYPKLSLLFLIISTLATLWFFYRIIFYGKVLLASA